MEKEEKIMLSRIIVTGVLFALSFFSFWSSIGKLIISIICYILIGYDVVFESIKGIFKGEFLDEKFLMMVASIGAFILGEYSEAVAVMLFYQLGEFLQDLATENSKKSITKLLDLRPEYAIVLRDGKEVKVSPEEVQIGEIIVVSSGERISLDGKIVLGNSNIDTSALTGESMPQEATVGDQVYSGSVNLNSTLQIEVTSLFENSKIAKIIELTKNSENNKAKSEKFITKFAKIYTPVVVGLAVLLAIIPSLFTGNWTTWINRALTFLVVSCPCALVVSIPLSFFAGIGGASKHGILIKGANFIEILAKTKTIAFDKTGTLTKGNFEVTEIYPNEISEEELLEICATAESSSSHPIATSIKQKYGKEISAKNNMVLTTLSGFGIKAEIEKDEIYVGNLKLMESIGITPTTESLTGTVVYVARNKKYLGAIVVSDTEKESSKTAIERLNSLGISKTVMLTGDKHETAEKIANNLGITEYFAELLPEDKLSKLNILKNEPNSTVAFVGDGINDSPVLKSADVGIAMGALGSDIAIESADVVLMDDNPEKIADAIEISRKTQRLVTENIVFTISFKVLMLILGAFGLATMWAAVFADVGVSLIAIVNALRAFKHKKAKK
jgi:Cd2+/Zn2+-exporting ATPase